MNNRSPRKPTRAAARTKPRNDTPRNVRALAAEALCPVLEARESLNRTLGPAMAACKPVDRGLLQTLVMGTVRHAIYYRALLKPLLQRAPAPLVEALLLVGIHQLLALRIPDHAAISETVEAARQLGQDRQTGFVNGVLRAFLRQQAELRQQAAPWVHAHPAWLVQRLQKDWPQHWPDILQANNEQGALTLRVNRLQGSREAYLALLEEADIAATACTFSPDGIRLAQLADITSLPGFADGLVSVQDEAAQLAALLLAPAAGMQVLDACAAPGGKTAHLLELAPELGGLLALDVAPERCLRVDETLQRLNLGADNVTVLAADAGMPGDWSEAAHFDRILLDAPCTATGVIRRHPDIKLLRREEDVAATARQQSALLEHLWSLLAPGGRLLYATCSLLKAENEDRVAAFLADRPDAREVTIEAEWGMARPHGRQLLPTANGHDGFYYCLLEKAPA